MKYDIKQLSVFLENKAGELSDFTHVLSTNGISIKSILLADSTDFGLVRTIVDNPEKAKAILEATAKAIGAREVATRDDIVKVSIVGVGMRSHAGVASKMFTALAEESINILMISTSEIKISVIIEENYLELAVRALHTAFGLDREHGESSVRA